MRLYSAVVLSSAFKLDFFKIYKMLILYFQIFQGGFEVLNAIFKFLCLPLLLPPLCITICTTFRKFVDVLLVVELLIYRKKYFLL